MPAVSLALSLSFLLGGCANYTHRVAAGEVPTLNDAYLYGRFYMNAPKALLALDGHQTMGFVIECEDKNKYTLRFNLEDPVLAIKIKPSNCSWTETVFSDADGKVRSRKPAPPELFKHITFKPGYAYYLGDFAAELKTSMPSYNVIRTEWNITSAKDNYEATTQYMQNGYPNLKALPTENRAMLSASSDGLDESEITEARIRAEYDRIKALQGDTDYRVRHIMVPVESEALAVLAGLKRGESFETLAKVMSKDPGSKDKGGDLGWNVPENFTPDFAKAMKALKPAGVTKVPVHTEFGWHVIEVLETRPHAFPPFEELKDKIAQSLRKKGNKPVGRPPASTV
jgi:parvulin-like peptidyl-prolyl isomerase